MLEIKPLIRVQPQLFNIAQEIDRVKQKSNAIGAVVSFIGYCRDEYGHLEALELEHYPLMAEKQCRRIAERAITRWPLLAVSIIHRFGTIAVGEQIVLVITASAHRHAAFEAANFLMDFLKTDAPFWKKEYQNKHANGRPNARSHAEGTEHGWVSSHENDAALRAKWDKD